MKNPLTLEITKIDEQVNFWPGLIDMLTSVLMVFLLIHLLQTTLNIEDLEAAYTRSKQAKFKDIFEREFGEEIRAGTVSIHEGLNLLQITFSDRILFETGKYELQEIGKGVLKRCANVFNRVSESEYGEFYDQIQVEGHTDNRPVTSQVYPRNNWELSTARAISVVQFLTASEEDNERLSLEEKLPPEERLDPEMFSTNGYAFYKPVASNATEKGQARNRRIEIRVVFSTPKAETPTSNESEVSFPNANQVR